MGIRGKLKLVIFSARKKKAIIIWTKIFCFAETEEYYFQFYVKIFNNQNEMVEFSNTWNTQAKRTSRNIGSHSHWGDLLKNISWGFPRTPLRSISKMTYYNRLIIVEGGKKPTELTTKTRKSCHTIIKTGAGGNKTPASADLSNNK